MAWHQSFRCNLHLSALMLSFVKCVNMLQKRIMPMIYLRHRKRHRVKFYDKIQSVWIFSSPGKGEVILWKKMKAYQNKTWKRNKILCRQSDTVLFQKVFFRICSELLILKVIERVAPYFIFFVFFFLCNIKYASV